MSDSRETPLFVSVPKAAKLMGVSAERLRRAIELHQVGAVAIGKRQLVARATIERLAQLEKGAA